MGRPIRTAEPLVFWLPAGEVGVDFDLVKARPAGHCILVCDDVPFGAEASNKSHQAKAAGNRESASISKAGEINPDEIDVSEALPKAFGVGIAGEIYRHNWSGVICRQLGQRGDFMGPVIGLKPCVGDNNAHIGVFQVETRTAAPSAK